MTPGYRANVFTESWFSRIPRRSLPTPSGLSAVLRPGSAPARSAALGARSTRRPGSRHRPPDAARVSPRQRLRDAVAGLAVRAVPAGFGGRPTGARLDRIRRSPQFSAEAGAFRNPVPTRRVAPGGTVGVLYASLTASRVRRRPARPVPLHRPDSRAWTGLPSPGLRLSWLGHATVLAEIAGRRVLFDPVWGERCTPIAPFGPRRLHPAPVPLDELGPVDLVVVSHDHYDHLDLATVRGLAARHRPHFAVPLGMGAHLERWGVPPDRICELDWHESAEVAGVRVTATPARHYCSRGPWVSRYQLWASWVVEGGGHRLFHSGDTGYFPGFAETGAAYGPFDATLIQVGAYSRWWPDVHMTPEEGVQAHLDLRGRLLLPVHWGTFDLAPHPWEEPAERVLAAALRAGAAVALPRPGELFDPADPPAPEPWWRGAAAPAAPRRLRRARPRSAPSRTPRRTAGGAHPAASPGTALTQDHPAHPARPASPAAAAASSPPRAEGPGAASAPRTPGTHRAAPACPPLSGGAAPAP